MTFSSRNETKGHLILPIGALIFTIAFWVKGSSNLILRALPMGLISLTALNLISANQVLVSLILSCSPTTIYVSVPHLLAMSFSKDNISIVWEPLQKLLLLIFLNDSLTLFYGSTNRMKCLMSRMVKMHLSAVPELRILVYFDMS